MIFDLGDYEILSLKKVNVKVFSKIIAIILLTVLFAILFKSAIRTHYYAVTVSIEIKGDTDEICQLFYSEKNEFMESQSIKKHFRGGDSLMKITFRLPPLDIRNLRIDPGYKSNQYEISQIEIHVDSQTETYSGSEILSNFELTNLVHIDSPTSKSLLLKQLNSLDVQMVYKHSLDNKFKMVKYTEKNPLQIAIVLIYLLISLLTVLRGNKIFKAIVKITKTIHVYSSQTLVFIPTKYSIAIIILFLFKWFLVSSIQMTAKAGDTLDTALFVKLAYFIGSGKWLGPYDCLTLIKGFGYPMFIAITNFIGIALFLAQHIVLGFASYIMVKAFSPILHKSNWKIALFAILLFNPVTSNFDTTSILRDAFFNSISIMVVAAFTGIYLRRNNKIGSLIKWSVFAGVALFIQQNTREEGFVFLPFLIILSILTFVTVYKFTISAKLPLDLICKIRKISRIALIVFLPYFLLTIGNLTLSSINYIKYGCFIRNEIKSKNFSDAFSALSKITTDKWIINVPVSKEARMKAYQVSPLFLDLKNILDSENNKWKKFGKGDTTEIKGGWFMWALRDATENAGYHKSLSQSQEFYKQLAFEINNAFETGKLKKKKAFSLFSFTWDNRYAKPSIAKLKEIGKFVICYKGYSPYPRISKGDMNAIIQFQNITGEIACVEKLKDIQYPLSSRIKFYLLKTVTKLYSVLNPVFFLAAVLSFIFLTCLLFLKRTRLKVWDSWLISSIFILICLSRMVLIAFISVSQWEAVNMHYLGLSYPFLLTIEFLAIFSVLQYLKNHNHHEIS